MHVRKKARKESSNTSPQTYEEFPPSARAEPNPARSASLEANVTCYRKPRALPTLHCKASCGLKASGLFAGLENGSKRTSQPSEALARAQVEEEKEQEEDDSEAAAKQVCGKKSTPRSRRSTGNTSAEKSIRKSQNSRNRRSVEPRSPLKRGRTCSREEPRDRREEPKVRSKGDSEAYWKSIERHYRPKFQTILPKMDLRMSLSELSILDDEADAGALSLLPLSVNTVPGGNSVSDKRSRVRKEYSGRSSRFLNEEVIGKQKLRGPSGAHLPLEQQTREIHVLESLQHPENKTETEILRSVSASSSVSSATSTELSQGLQQHDDRNDPRRPQYWTPEEDAALKAAVERFGDKSWKNIAASVPGRTSTQCIQRWKKVLKPGLKKGHWATEEDELLVAGVRAQMARNVKRLNWSEVSKTIPMRSCKQCRERWVNHLNPDVNKGVWTPEEDQRLWALQELAPRKWAKIARQIPGRTENMVKVRWNILNRAQQKGDDPDGGPPMLHAPFVSPSMGDLSPSDVSSSVRTDTTLGPSAHIKTEMYTSDQKKTLASQASFATPALQSNGPLHPHERLQNNFAIKRESQNINASSNTINNRPMTSADPSASDHLDDCNFDGVDWESDLLRPMDFDPATAFQNSANPMPYAQVPPHIHSSAPQPYSSAPSELASHGNNYAPRPGSSTSDFGSANNLDELGLSHLDFAEFDNTTPSSLNSAVPTQQAKVIAPVGGTSTSKPPNSFQRGGYGSAPSTALPPPSFTASGSRRAPIPQLRTSTSAPLYNAASTKDMYQGKSNTSAAGSNAPTFRRSISDFKASLPPGNGDILETVPATFDDLGVDDLALSRELHELYAPDH